MKKHGWPRMLSDYIEAAMVKEFSYGSFDCALFCADWVQIATGLDHAKDLRGYDSMRDACRIVGRFGSMQAMVTQLLGAEPIHAAWAQRGDVVLMRCHPSFEGAPEGLGICLGLRSALPAARGIVMVPTLDASAAWKI